MAFNLSETKIRQRLVEWRNLKRLHAEQKQRNQQLEAELRELKARYKQDMAKRDQLIEKLMLRIADLEKMVFGSKRNGDRGSNSSQSSPDKDTIPSTPATTAAVSCPGSRK